MVSAGSRTNLDRFAVTLLPSMASAPLCCLFGAAVVGLWLLGVSVNIGTSLPRLFDGEWSVFYTNSVVQPVLVFMHNPIINKILFVLAFGVLGLAVYALGGAAVAAAGSWREAHHFIRVTHTGAVTHPGERSFLAVVTIRLVVSAIALAAAVNFLPPLIDATASLAELTVEGVLPFVVSIPELLLLAGAWSLVAHFAVVTLRLLWLRIRLLG